MLQNEKWYNKAKLNFVYKKSGLYLISIIILFICIGLLTTIKPAYRLSSHTITKWTSDIDSSTFLHLLGMENRAFEQAYPRNKNVPQLSTVFFQIVTNIKPSDPKSIIGQEVPGFSFFRDQIIVAGEGTDYTSYSIESSPPLEDVLKDREAISDEPSLEETEKEEQEETTKLKTGKDVVFLYNSHNRESFLPHLPGVTDPNDAHHGEINITKISNRFAKALEANGIGVNVDDTDHMSVLNERGWTYGKSYTASREVVEAAVDENKDLQYFFDLHRDSIPRKASVKEINGEDYAKILFVIGGDYSSYEKNLALATKLNALIEDKYPGLSRGVKKNQGPGMNGVYNQDISENALLIEFGGYDNSLEELYRTADVVAEVFSEFYWDAEKVEASP